MRSRKSDEAGFDHVEDALSEVLGLLLGDAFERAVEDEQGESVDGGPREKLGSGTAAGGQDAGLHHKIEGAREELEGVEAGFAGVGGVGGFEDSGWDGERGAKEAGLLAGETHVGCADGSQAAAGEDGWVAGGADRGDFGLDGYGERGERGGTHGLEQVVLAGEVAVGGVGYNAGAARSFAKDDSGGTSGTCEIDSSLEEGLAQIAVSKGFSRGRMNSFHR